MCKLDFYLLSYTNLLANVVCSWNDWNKFHLILSHLKNDIFKNLFLNTVTTHKGFRVSS